MPKKREPLITDQPLGVLCAALSGEYTKIIKNTKGDNGNIIQNNKTQDNFTLHVQSAIYN